MEILTKAIEFATKKHGNQKRKWSGEPYTEHLNNVAQIVKGIGASQEMQAAAWLHDVVEDTDVTHQEIVDEFGVSIANIVYGVTDKSKPEDGNRKARKEIDRIHLSMGCSRVKTLKLADVIDNTRNLKQVDERFYKVYRGEILLLLPLLKGGNEFLMEKAYKQLTF
jgi:(p)ppGpp synthase/HD superfamily hydrolase